MAKSALIDPEWQHKFATVADGVQLHYVEAGPSDGLPIIMVHGWPDLWFGWRVSRALLSAYLLRRRLTVSALLQQHQIRALSPKYRLIVPGE